MEYDESYLYDETFTYEELIKEVDSEFDYMTDEENYQRARDGDPTFKHWVLSQMKEGQTVVLNEETKKHEII